MFQYKIVDAEHPPHGKEKEKEKKRRHSENQRLSLCDVADDELRNPDGSQVAGDQRHIGQRDNEHQKQDHQKVPWAEDPQGAFQSCRQKTGRA